MEAVKWFRAAATQGQSGAKFELGAMYASGQGVTRNHKKAVKWFKAASGQSNARAQYNLGLLFRDGNGVNQDIVLAYKWIKLAEVLEHEDAKRSLNSLEVEMSESQVLRAKSMVKVWEPNLVDLQ